MRARALVIAALLGAFVLGAAAPASAHIADFRWQVITYDPPDDEGTVEGAITCTAGETFTVVGTVRQKDPGYRGRGSTGGTCTGSSQEWNLSYSRVSGDMVDVFPFAGGEPTRVRLVAKTFNGGVVDDKEVVVYQTS